MTKGYDSACYNLAAMFLADEPEKNTEENRDELAQHIQTEIEGWIEHILLATRCECGGGPRLGHAEGCKKWLAEPTIDLSPLKDTA